MSREDDLKKVNELWKREIGKTAFPKGDISYEELERTFKECCQGEPPEEPYLFVGTKEEAEKLRDYFESLEKELPDGDQS